MDEGAKLVIDNSADGNAQQHTHHAADACTHRHGEEHPNTGQADAAAHHMGIDEVALQLLEDHEEHHEPHGLHKGHGQNQQRANDSADPCTQDGDEGGDAHQHGNDGSEGEAEDGHTDKHQHADDDRLGHLSLHEAGEGGIGTVEEGEEIADAILTEGGVQQTLHVAAQLLLLRQDVDGEGDAHDQIEHGGEHGAHHRGGDIDGGIHHQLTLLLQERLYTLQKAVHGGDSARFGVNGGLQLGEGNGVICQPCTKLVILHIQIHQVGGDDVHHVLHRPHQIGHENEDDGGNGSQHQQKADDEAYRAAQLRGYLAALFLFKQLAPQILQRAHNEVQHIGNGQAQNQRRDNGEKRGDQLTHRGDIVGDPPQHGDAHRQG